MPGLHFEFVSPESVLFSGDVDQVDLPGMEGDLGVLPGHAPLVTLLRPGIVTIIRDGNREPVVVVGGFAEIGPGGLTVLAERAGSRGISTSRRWQTTSKTPKRTSPTARATRSATNSCAVSTSYAVCRRR